MDRSVFDQLIEQAKSLELAADRFREAARKIRDAARLVQLAGEKGTTIIDLFGEAPVVCSTAATSEKTSQPSGAPTTTTTSTTPAPMSAAQLPSDRLAQLNELLRELGPSQRHVIIALAERRGIPKNTTASYVTRDNFDYMDGFWYIKGTKEWPPRAYRLLAEPGRFEIKGGEAKGEVRPSGED